MHFKPYPLPFEQWATQPLETGLPDNDSGYTKVALLDGHVPAIAELTEVLTRPVYDRPVDIFGNSDDSLLLPGGVKGGRVFGTETVIRGIELANKQLIQLSGGEYQLVVVEVWRSRTRQRAGHRKTFLQLAALDDVNKSTPAQVLTVGKQADGIFSYVRPRLDTRYEALRTRLRGDTVLMAELEAAAGGPVTDDLLETYIGLGVSLGYRDMGDAGLELPATHSVHGGGAWDAYIADKNGKPYAWGPFDFAHPLSAYRFMEDDANYDVLQKEIAGNPIVQMHYAKLGFTPGTFSLSEWKKMQAANRIRIRLLVAMGATTYDEESWHCEFGTEVSDVQGTMIVRDALADTYPDSGGTGYTVIRQGVSGTAVWHTAGTEQAMRKRGLLEE